MTLVHILDKKNDQIIGTLNSEKGEMRDPIRTTSIQNKNIFDLVAFKKFDILEKRNRLLVQDTDGFFHEYIINYAEQYKRNEKIVKSDASFIDLSKAKVISPEVLTGATSQTATSFALEGTEWQVGNIEFTFIRSLTIDEYTDPYSLLKLIASTFDLEIIFRIVVEGSRVIGRYVDMRSKMAGFEGKEIVFGKDLIGIHRIEDSSRIVTALLGAGPEKEDGTRLTVFVEDEAARQRWGRNGNHLIEVYEPESTDQDMTEARLKTLTENELQKRIDAAVSYEGEAASIEHVLGREHERARVGQTVRIKDDYYSPPLYLEARIQETTENVALRQVLGFKIGNFIEYKKEDLEKQVALLKQLIAQKASLKYADDKAAAAVQSAATYTEDYSEKKKVLSANPPIDTSVIWIKPEPEKNVNIAHAYDGVEWVPLTTTNASDIVEGEMLFDRLHGGAMTLGGINNGNGLLEVKDANDVTHTSVGVDGVNTNKITITRPDGSVLINKGTANFDFNIQAHEPPFSSAGIITKRTEVGAPTTYYAYGTSSYNWQNVNFYTYRHTGRYLRLQLAYGTVDGYSGWIRIVEVGGTELYRLNYLVGLGSFGSTIREVTIDLGVPTMNMRSFYLDLASNVEGRFTYLRIIRMWLEE